MEDPDEAVMVWDNSRCHNAQVKEDLVNAGVDIWPLSTYVSAQHRRDASAASAVRARLRRWELRS